MDNNQNQHLLNHQIKSSQVLLLDQNGEKVGVVTREEALKKATEQELDLMQVGQNKDIAICKILKYESWLYHENKKKQKQEFNNRAQELKSIQFRPNIGENDLQLKLKKIEHFLEDNHKVKIILKFKSREGTMKTVNEALVQKLLDNLAEKGVLDSKVNTSPKEINFIMKPEKKVVAKMKM